MLLIGLSVLLCFDGNIYGVSPPDPAGGRDGGCFTVLDDILGTTKPVGLLRLVEMLSPLFACSLSYLLLHHGSTQKNDDPAAKSAV